MIKGAGARLNDATITDENLKVTAADINADGTAKLSSGKKKHVILKAV